MHTNLLLRRLDVVSYKNKSGTDTAQIPVSATVNLYRQGASVRASVTVPISGTPTAVELDDIGGIVAGDDLSINGASPTLSVDSVVDDVAYVLLIFASAEVLAVGDRLTPTTVPRPVAYKDPLGQVSIGTSFTTAIATGRGSAYVWDWRYDYIVNITGVTPRLYADAVGGYVLEAPHMINVLDYASVQAAVDALPPHGGTVFFPRGDYRADTRTSFVPPLILPYDRPVHLLGEGVDATRLINGFPGGGANLDMIYMAGDEQIVEGMTLLGWDLSSGTGRGIVLRRRGPIVTSNAILFNPNIRNVLIWKCGSWGIDVDTTPRDELYQFVVKAAFDNVEVRGCGGTAGGGIHVGGDGSTTLHFKNCQVRGCGNRPLLCDGEVAGPAGVSFIDSIVEHPSDREALWLRFDTCKNLLLQHLWVEGLAPTSGDAVDYLITLTGKCTGVGIYDCFLSRLGSAESLGIDIKAVDVGSEVDGVVVQNTFVECDRVPSSAPILLQTGANHVTVVGGTVHTYTPSEAIEPITVEGSGSIQTVIINAMSRIRLPALTTTQRDALDYVAGGDIIYNSDRNQLHVGTPAGGWRAVLSEGYVRLPSYSSGTRPSVTSDDFGFMIYDTTLGQILYVDNSGAWRKILSDPV
jgi:hypothetical protein